ncbi:alkaline phosphatase [Thermodesulfobacteriota bacterium]
MSKKIFLLLVAIFINACSSNSHDSNTSTSQDCESTIDAKNIILFIGDGMGDNHRKAAQWLKVGQNGSLAMDNMTTAGFSRTSSANSAITDSAAAATALATGAKTKNGVIGLDENLNELTTILEEAQSQGKAVGLVTTTQMSHATPAAFAAHVESRGMMTEIAVQMVSAGVDVLLGGGEDEFLPTFEIGCYPESGEQPDGRNLINEAMSAGYTYVCDASSFYAVDPASTTYLLGLFADEGMSRPFSPSLAEMTQKAIDILSPNPSGFFLMVEGGQIDWASHSNDAYNALNDTVDFDEAVDIAKAYAKNSCETLIIVTADHETGGMTTSLSQTWHPDEDGPFYMPGGTPFYVNWASVSHTASEVFTTAQGPSSELLTVEFENTFIYDLMKSAQN